MHALKSMCWQVQFEMEREGFVTLVTDSRLKNMGENVPGKGYFGENFANVVVEREQQQIRQEMGRADKEMGRAHKVENCHDDAVGGGSVAVALRSVASVGGSAGGAGRGESDVTGT
jgi:hypothetical protein